MKIFHVITLADLGGAQSVVLNLVNRLVLDGHEVFVLSELQGPMWDLLDKRVGQIRIKSLQRAISPIKEVKVMAALKKAHRLHKPDVIHLHSSKIGALGRLVFPSSKIVYTVHGFDSIRVAFRKFLPVEKFCQNKCAQIVGVSKYDVEGMKAEGITQNVSCIYNAISDFTRTEIKDQRPDITDFLTKNKTVGAKIILCIARLSAPKRFDLFCEVAQAFSYDPRFKFVWIGNREVVKDAPENVFCMGEAPDAHQYLKYADVFMLPSNYEGLPMSILEALCYGVPVVASAVGGITEILDGENGFAVQNIKEDFLDAIHQTVNNDEKYLKFSKNARLTYEKSFDIQEMYKKYMNLYSLL